MSDRDRLARLIASTRGIRRGYTRNFDRAIADAILADGWVRLQDADLDAMLMWADFEDEGISTLERIRKMMVLVDPDKDTTDD